MNFHHRAVGARIVESKSRFLLQHNEDFVPQSSYVPVVVLVVDRAPFAVHTRQITPRDASSQYVRYPAL